MKTGLAEQSVHVYERAIVLLLRAFQPNQAFDLSERARARGFLDHIGNVHFNIRQGADASFIQQEQELRLELSALDGGLRQERSKPRPQQNAELIQLLTPQLTAKQQQYEDFLTRLKLANPEYASLVSVEPLRFSEVQRLLDKGTTLLSYFTTPDKTLAFVVRRDSLLAVELPVTEKEL